MGWTRVLKWAGLESYTHWASQNSFRILVITFNSGIGLRWFKVGCDHLDESFPKISIWICLVQSYEKTLREMGWYFLLGLVEPFSLQTFDFVSVLHAYSSSLGVTKSGAYPWLYPMRRKSKVFQHFYSFQKLVENYFDLRIKSFQSDGGLDVDKNQCNNRKCTA